LQLTNGFTLLITTGEAILDPSQSVTLLAIAEAQIPPELSPLSWHDTLAVPVFAHSNGACGLLQIMILHHHVPTSAYTMQHITAIQHARILASFLCNLSKLSQTPAVTILCTILPIYSRPYNLLILSQRLAITRFLYNLTNLPHRASDSKPLPSQFLSCQGM
jgi:hypothetical protein